MANVLIRDLIEATSLSPDDLLEANVDPSGTPLSRKVKVRNVSPWVLIGDTTVSSPTPNVDHTFDPSLYLKVVTQCRGAAVEAGSTDNQFLLRVQPLTSAGYLFVLDFGRSDSTAITGVTITADITCAMGNGVNGGLTFVANGVESQNSATPYSYGTYDSLDSTASLTLRYRGQNPNNEADLNITAGRFITYGLLLPV